MSAGDYPLFLAENAQNRSPETSGQFAKARHWRAFLRVSGTFPLDAGLAGWGGRIRTSAWWNQNQARPSMKSTRILKNVRNLTPDVSIG
jgi:hypothetical protein